MEIRYQIIFIKLLLMRFDNSIHLSVNLSQPTSRELLLKIVRGKKIEGNV